MKKVFAKSQTIVLLLLLVAGMLLSCGSTPSVWENAIYREDAAVGEGGTCFTLKITAEEKTVTLTVRSDEATLASALSSSGLAEGEAGPYGLYIKSVNGIRADYNLDGGYFWSLSVNGTPSMVGADGVTPENGAVYEFTRTK